MFGEILSYVYSGTLHVSLDKVQPLYQAADLLQLDYVRDTCSRYMAMNVERSTCVDLYKFADVFSVHAVQKRCLQWIARNFTEVASSEEFPGLMVNRLTEIISHIELDVKEETAVWEAVVRWVQHSREDRLHHLPSILPHIRFNLLTSDDIAAILEHPLIREDPGSSEVIRNVVKKVNIDPKPRFGMTTEMAVLLNPTEGSNEILFMNPREDKYISCSYKPEDLPNVTDIAVTNENDIYILDTKELEDENQVCLFKYNHAENVWKQASVSSISKVECREERLLEADGILYYIAYVPVDKRPLLQMRKYDPHTNQWQECSHLQLDETINNHAMLFCGPNLYILTATEAHCYDPGKDIWSRKTPSWKFPEFVTAVALGTTEIFCTDYDIYNPIVYDTESDRWQELNGWPNPGNRYIDDMPGLFVLGNQLHALIICRGEETETDHESFVYVYDRSADAWTDLNATLPGTRYMHAWDWHCTVAHMHLPYLEGK
ncbi:kelch repeat and BTB domain-containing protein 8-like [Branchiostoma floridae]|uniref:Kelch repeat and BTB domain-containing protein 8-like n=1 Tax=Branchiostoma floridae TaxID=7739 RepID=A0A9J7LTK2_BRAFL|nr:kelch repeat and BTB domain-containing protein 8-like [Branchiostoma floridae]